MSRALELPPRLYFDGELPVDGRCGGEVSFTLPDGGRVESDASLYFDPEHPEQGSEAELVGLGAEQLQLLETYIEQRATS